MKREKIYVAMPYSAPYPEMIEANVARAIAVGLEIYKKGHIPFIPHLSQLIETYAQEHGIQMSYDDYMELDDAWRMECDATYYEPSPGADIEKIRSWEEGQRIYYNLDEIKPAYR